MIARSLVFETIGVHVNQRLAIVITTYFFLIHFFGN